MEEKKVVNPIHFVEKDRKSVEVHAEPKKNDAELNFKCKYGSLNIKLGEIPVVKDVL